MMIFARARLGGKMSEILGSNGGERLNIDLLGIYAE
jgi:hypothetical protein